MQSCFKTRSDAETAKRWKGISSLKLTQFPKIDPRHTRKFHLPILDLYGANCCIVWGEGVCTLFFSIFQTHLSHASRSFADSPRVGRRPLGVVCGERFDHLVVFHILSPCPWWEKRHGTQMGLSQLSIWIIIQDYPLSLITQVRWHSEIFEDGVQPIFANILRFTLPHGHPSQSFNWSHSTILSRVDMIDFHETQGHHHLTSSKT